MNRNKVFALGLGILFFLIGFANSLCAKDIPTKLRFRYCGSSVFALPTGYCKYSVGYINDNTNPYFFASQNLGNLLEVSVLKPLDGDNKNKSIFNGKLALFSEGMGLPAISLGIADVNAQTGNDRIFFVAASKNIDVFGFTAHAGMYRDPISKDKIAFYGAEKIVFPLLSIAAERVDDVNTYGIRISPYPGVSLDIAQRDGKEEIFNLIYSRSY